MKHKHDGKNVPQPTSDEAITRRRLKKFHDQLKERTEFLAQFESILGIAADGGPDAPFRTADEVEVLVVGAMRKLGNQTMQQWAHEAQARSVEDCKKEHPGARLKLPGCAWLPSNAESIAQLRVLRSNDPWPELWPLAA